MNENHAFEAESLKVKKFWLILKNIQKSINHTLKYETKVGQVYFSQKFNQHSKDKPSIKTTKATIICHLFKLCIISMIKPIIFKIVI